MSIRARPRVVFFYEYAPERMPSFVAADLAALQQEFEVTWAPCLEGPGWRRGLGPTGWLPSRAMVQRARSSDVVVQWFAVPAAPMVAARLSRRRSLLITAGYDVAAVPQIGYGRMVGQRTRRMGQLALTLATRILSISRSNQAEVRRWAPWVRPELLYLGFEAASFQPSVKRPIVMTVGSVRDDYLLRKGLLTFARTSRLLPHLPFLLVGKHLNDTAVALLRREGGANLELTGALDDASLRRRLGEAAVYAQLSRHEAFGCAVAEAMLSGCTPVVTGCGALPEVAGDAGYYVPADDPPAAANAVQTALEKPTGVASRTRIERLFPRSARHQGLVERLSSLLGRGRVPEARP